MDDYVRSVSEKHTCFAKIRLVATPLVGIIFLAVLLTSCQGHYGSVPPGYVEARGHGAHPMFSICDTCRYGSDPYPSDPGGNFGGGAGSGGDGPAGSSPSKPPSGSGIKPGCASDYATAKRQIGMHFNDALAADRTDPSHDHEFVGYIYEDANGYSYLRDLGIFPTDSQGHVTIPAPINYSGFTVVGWYHTHPEQYNFGNGNGVEPSNGTHFSPPDVSFSQGNGVPSNAMIGYVGEENDVGINTGDPSSYPTQEQFQWYTYNPFAPSGAKPESANGNFSAGSSSCG